MNLKGIEWEKKRRVANLFNNIGGIGKIMSDGIFYGDVISFNEVVRSVNEIETSLKEVKEEIKKLMGDQDGARSNED